MQVKESNKKDQCICKISNVTQGETVSITGESQMLTSKKIVSDKKKFIKINVEDKILAP